MISNHLPKDLDKSNLSLCQAQSIQDNEVSVAPHQIGSQVRLYWISLLWI